MSIDLTVPRRSARPGRQRFLTAAAGIALLAGAVSGCGGAKPSASTAKHQAVEVATTASTSPQATVALPTTPPVTKTTSAFRNGWYVATGPDSGGVLSNSELGFKIEGHGSARRMTQITGSDLRDTTCIDRPLTLGSGYIFADDDIAHADSHVTGAHVVLHDLDRTVTPHEEIVTVKAVGIAATRIQGTIALPGEKCRFTLAFSAHWVSSPGQG